MNNVIETMLGKYSLKNNEERENAAKETTDLIKNESIS